MSAWWLMLIPGVPLVWAVIWMTYRRYKKDDGI